VFARADSIRRVSLESQASSRMSIKSRRVSAVGSIAIICVALGISGCSEELGPESMLVTRVKGSVTEGGRPLSRGWVEFFPVDGTVGNLRSAQIRTDGTFEANGVAVGQNLIRLVHAGIRKDFDIFSKFQSPIRRLVPAQRGEPLRIELVDEAIRFQSSLPRQASTGSAGAGEKR
jgi:hypothetical protein